MSVRNDLMEDIGESFGYVNLMLDKKIEQIKLDVAERSATTASGLITGIILAVLGGMVSLFGLIAVAFLIAGEEFKSAATGFGIVAGGLLLLLILIFLLKRQLIVNPAVRKVISIFFAKPSNSQ